MGNDMILDEALTPQQRKAKARQMKRLAPRIARKKALAMKKKASPEKLKARAEKAAKILVRNKMLSGKKYEDLPFAQRAQIDAKVEKKAGVIKKIAKKLLPKVKEKELERLKKMKQGDSNE